MTAVVHPGASASRPEVIPELGLALERLVEAPTGRHRFLSCYVHLGADDRLRGNYRNAMRDRFDALLESPEAGALAPAEREGLEHDMLRVMNVLDDREHLPHAPGLALFLADSIGLALQVPLPAVLRTRVTWDLAPSLGELLVLQQRFGVVLGVAIDRTHARIFRVDAGTVSEVDCVFSVAHRGGKFRGDRRDAPGCGERVYHARRLEERHRHYVDVIAELKRLTAREPVRGLVLAGPLTHTSALAAFLPRPLAAMLLGSVRVNPTAVTAARMRDMVIECEAGQQAAGIPRALADLRDAIGRGWGLNGVEPVLTALGRGQVRHLFVRGDVPGAGFRCTTTGQLTVTAAECSGQGEAAPVADLADEAIDEALRQGLEVTVLPIEVLATDIDRFAAVLRFK